MSCEFIPIPSLTQRLITWPLALDTVKSMLRSPESWQLLSEELKALAAKGYDRARLAIETQNAQLGHLTKSISSSIDDILMAYHHPTDPFAAVHKDPAEFARNIHQQTTNVSSTLHSKRVGEVIRITKAYTILVDCHVTLCVEGSYEAWDNRESFEKPAWMTNTPGQSLFPFKLLQLCIRDRQKVVDRFKLVGGNSALGLSDAQIEALWWVLLLRSICWWASIDVECPTSSIPSEYYYSQLPVYIS